MSTSTSVPFADMPNDLDFVVSSSGTVTDIREAARQRFASAKPAPTEYSEPCKKCNGSGYWRSYSGFSGGTCFACKGKGYFNFKTSALERERARVQAELRKARALKDNETAFAEAQPAAWSWILANVNSFEFASDMRKAVQRFGSLTDGQLNAITRCAARDEARKAERAAAQAQAASKPIERLTAFWTVLQRHAKFYAGDITISRRNADQLCWIKHADAEKVVGKIDNGVLTLWNRPGIDLDEVRRVLAEFEADPLGSAKLYGKLAGRCCSCGRELTDEGSIAAGIGPICATKFE